MDNENLVKTIKNLCKEKNISISQLEKELNFGAGLISRWVKSDPSLGKIVDIADYFNVSLDETIGRKKSENFNTNDEWIQLLKHLTNSTSIVWKDVTNTLISPLKDNCEIFQIGNDDYTIFFTECDGSYFYVVASYEYNYGIFEDIECTLYLQPDKNSAPVLQECNKRATIELWQLVYSSVKGAPDEYKAELIKQKMIKENRSETIKQVQELFHNIPDPQVKVNKLINDEAAKRALLDDSTPEVKQAIELFTDEKVIQAIKSTQKLMQYFENIESLKVENNDKK